MHVGGYIMWHFLSWHIMYFVYFHSTTFCKTNILLLFLESGIITIMSCRASSTWVDFLIFMLGSPKFTFLMFLVLGSLTYTLNFLHHHALGFPSLTLRHGYSASSGFIFIVPHVTIIVMGNHLHHKFLRLQNHC